jgi:hypothetical protein
MKALTFKKTLLASAMFAVAGTASAATSVTFGIPTAETAATDTNIVTKVKDVVAYEEIIDKDLEIVPASEDSFIQIKLDGALFQNDILTLTFTNGGIKEGTLDSGYRIAQVTPNGTGGAVDVVGVAYSIVSKEFNPSGSIKTLNIRLDGNVTSGATLYIGSTINVNSDNSTVAANQDWTVAEAVGLFTTNGTGLPIEMDKGTVSGAQMSVTASINYVAANLTDETFGSSKFATAVTGVKTTFTGAGTKFIDRAEDDLKLINGETSVTAPGLKWEKITTVKENGVDMNFDGDTTDTDISVTHQALNPTDGDLTYSAKIVLPADCEAVLEKGTDGKVVADAVTIEGATVTKSTTETCTWSSTSVGNDKDIVVKFSGKDKLSDASASVSYTAKYESVTTPALDKTGTVYTLSGDVQTITGSSATLPYIYSFPGSGAFSYVKIDNSAAASTAKPISLVVEGTIQETVAGSVPMTFKNYFLKEVAAGELGEFTGTDILDALITPRGAAAAGFEDEAKTELSKSKGYHMSVTLKPVSTGSSLSTVKIDGVNTSGIGRTPVKVIMNGNTISSLTSELAVVDKNVDDIEAAPIAGLTAYAACVQAVTAETDVTPAYANAAALVTAVGGTSDAGATEYGLIQTQLNAANALQDTVLANVLACKTTHLP